MAFKSHREPIPTPLAAVGEDNLNAAGGFPYVLMSLCPYVLRTTTPLSSASSFPPVSRPTLGAALTTANLTATGLL